MNRYGKYFYTIENIIIILCLCFPVFASEADDEHPEEQYKLQRYKDMKRKQQKEYSKGIYNDDKKDYVEGWIGEDINYQKKVIKLKRDYREWVKERISGNKEIIFTDYEPLKTMKAVERQILWEYHNKFFKNEKKSESVTGKKIRKKNYKRIFAKEPDDMIEEKIIAQDEVVFKPKDLSIAENADNANVPRYFMPAIAGFLFISVLFVKRIYRSIKIKHIIHGSKSS